MIETICPHCGNKRTFEDSFAGRTFRCPNCKEPVTIQSVAEMVKAETDSHEISFETQIKKAEEEKKKKEERQIYEAQLKRLNDSYSVVKRVIWWFVAYFAVVIIADIEILRGNGGEFTVANVIIFIVLPVVIFVLVQRKRRKILQEIEDLKSGYLKKIGKE